MPSYKLIYFKARGIAETARMLLKLAGQEFEDVRVDTDEWAKMKESMPVGQLPVLEVDGVQISQSNAINRYLAREFGFAGKDSLAMARVDMIVDSIGDIIQKGTPVRHAQTEEDKAAAIKKYLEETAEPGFQHIQALLEQNNGGDGFFVGDEVTFADLAFVNMSKLITITCSLDFSKFPKLNALKDRVESIPAIAAWIKERPVTDM